MKLNALADNVKVQIINNRIETLKNSVKEIKGITPEEESKVEADLEALLSGLFDKGAIASEEELSFLKEKGIV